jgi:hypothetical protein
MKLIIKDFFHRKKINKNTVAVVSNKEVDDLKPEEEKPGYCCCCF